MSRIDDLDDDFKSTEPLSGTARTTKQRKTSVEHFYHCAHQSYTERRVAAATINSQIVLEIHRHGSRPKPSLPRLKFLERPMEDEG